MSFFKLLLNPKLRELSDSLVEINIHSGKPDKDPFILSMMFFSHIFFIHGFLGANRPAPAFPDAYKNIPAEILDSTYIALPIYFGYRCGLNNSRIGSAEEFKRVLKVKYPTLNHDVAENLISEWSRILAGQLDHLIFRHFEKHSIFQGVFEDPAAAERCFTTFINQTLDDVLKTYPVTRR